MIDVLQNFIDLVGAERISNIGQALGVLILGLGFAKVATSVVGRAMSARGNAQHTMIVQRVTRYGITVLVLVAALRHLGFDLSVLVGAAGILTIAVGFASQTSASNLISGLFLMAEQPFVIGDAITVGGTTGEVFSIDLLSVRLRTFDNLLVRIPNESLLKAELTNLTHFPIRRIDLTIGVAYREDLDRIKTLLEGLADRTPICLDEPAPVFLCKGFGESCMNIQFNVWAARQNFLPLRTLMYMEIKKAFDEAGIEIPFPHRSLYAGSMTEPLPIRLVGAADAGMLEVGD